MALPAGVTTCLATFGRAMDFTGAGAIVEITVQPSHTLIWAATGEIITEFAVAASASAGLTGSIELPHTNQSGFRDVNGNSITNWHYIVKVVIRKSTGSNRVEYTQLIQVPTGQSVIDIDLIPRATVVESPGLTPTAVVTSVNGEIGEVILGIDDLDSELIGRVETLEEDIPASPTLSTTDPLVTSDIDAGFRPGSRWVNTNTQVLFTCLSNAAGAAVWYREVADVQVFLASGTWTKPAWAATVHVTAIGNGAGGGSGAQQASGSAAGGGGGGGGGGFTSRTFAASLCGATETVTVGSPGVGGAARTTPSTAGNAGIAGTTVLFGNHVRAGAGTAGGAGGLAASGSGGAGGSGLLVGGAGGSGTNGAAGANGTSAAGSPSGGGGGGISSGGTAFAGGNGNVCNQTAGLTSGTSGVAGGGNGGNGTSQAVGEAVPGSSGGGGGASVTGVGGNGGDGGNYGAGGGGGGASLNGNNSGAGGNGGPGIVVVITT